MRDPKIDTPSLGPATPRERELMDALRASEARYRQLIDTASEGVWCLDTQGKTVFINQRMAEMLGYTVDEMQSHTVFDLSSPQDQAQASAVFQRRLDGITEQHDWCFKHKNGTDVWCLVCGSPTLDATGKVTGAIGLIADITARKHAEERVHRLSRIYAVSSSINEAIVRIRDPKELYGYACRVAVEQGNVLFAWIGVRNSTTGKLEVTGRFGGNDDYIERVVNRMGVERPENAGPGLRALNDGTTNFSNDIANDPTFFWKQQALSLGFRSCAVFPLKSNDAVIGVMAIYAAQVGYFSDEELRVLNALAANISFAVDSAAKREALQESERMMATLFGNLPGMIYRQLNDANWTFDLVSHGCVELTGYGQDHLLGNGGSNYEHIIHPLDRETMRSQAMAALQARRPFELFYRIVTKQGDQKWVWERGTGVYSEQNELRFIEGFITDVTARREAEDQVSAQAALLDKATDAIVLFGLDDAIYYWNRGAERLYGWSAREAIGNKITQLTCRDSVQRRVLVAKLIERGEWTGELTQFTKSGDEVIVDTSWTLVRDDLGKPRSILAINTDITQRKKLEAQFLTTQRLESIGTLAGGIAHDFNNILTAITGNAKLASSDLPADHPVKTPLHEIEKASLRASDLVRQILTFSRREEAHRQVARLRDIVAEALRLLRATLPAQIEIKSSYDDDVPDIAADTTQMHQVVINLGTNAAYAMRERGGILSARLDAVTIGANDAAHPNHLQPGRYARLSISDTGTGMNAATQQRIFEPFFTTKAPGQGTGLGLSVVHGIVRSHDGAIAVTSEVDQGTTFRLYFPQTDEEVRTPPTEKPRTTGNGQRILYVDDEEALVFLTTRVLERMGYQVTGRTDARQALSEFRADPTQFDAVVSDLSMPGMTGPELARAMLALRPNLPIVLTSGYIRDEDMKIVRELKIRDLVLKPNTVEDLGDTLHKVLTR